jgi:hypothetical protein
MAFQMRARRREDGGYDFEYGRQSKKLTAVCQQVGKKWAVIDGFGSGTIDPNVKLADVKKEWGDRAAVSYGEAPQSPVETSPPSTPPPTLPPRLPGPPRVGPPKLAPPPVAKPYDGPRCPECKQPITGWYGGLPPCQCGKPNDDNYEPDPFDPRMYEKTSGDRGRHLTPIGVLDMVFHWMLRNKPYVTTDGKLDPVWAEVQDVLQRNTGYPEYRAERFNVTT